MFAPTSTLTGVQHLKNGGKEGFEIPKHIDERDNETAPVLSYPAQQMVRTFSREDGHALGHTEINSVGLLLEERLADAILNDHTSRKVGRPIGDDHPI
ncbi:hypothetical protein J6590_062196 [Homalodisca vitripennis]|nr:hypothetical protein J6590_062196 [Homalodisca vitripennis]